MQQSSEIDETEARFLEHGQDLVSLLGKRTVPAVDRPRGHPEAYVNRLVVYLLATWATIVLSWVFFAANGGVLAVLLLLCMLPIGDCLFAGWAQKKTVLAET
jgi:hypothetical protein